MSEEKILKIASAFTMLVQCSADVYDCRAEGERTGIINPDYTDDEAISFLSAFYLLNDNYDKSYSPAIMSRTMETYCRPSFFSDFRFFYAALAKKLHQYEIDNKIYNLDIEVLMDVHEFALSGKMLGNKQHWNIFKEPYLTEWNNAFVKKPSNRGWIT